MSPVERFGSFLRGLTNLTNMDGGLVLIYVSIGSYHGIYVELCSTLDHGGGSGDHGEGVQ